MKKVPILFIKDDVVLIEMYRHYFEDRGYHSIIIRGGEEGLEKAIIEGPSLITFDTHTFTQGDNKHSMIIIFTYNSDTRDCKRPEVTSAVVSSEVFSKIEISLNQASG